MLALGRALLIVVGFLLVAVVVWIVGPYWSPLESEAARLIVIASVVACWVAYRLFRRLRARQKSRMLEAAVVAGPPVEISVPADVLKLRERFEEAIATLKEQRSGGYNLYRLPWYVIIGAPGSGKTTALVNSGLKFPLEQRMGKGALRGVGGTRNCDWWFTDEAVLLDTAGRYTTQDSDPTSDSQAWAEFLSLLRQYRPRRPMNGVILTISAQHLMAQGESVREAHVQASRRRLNELNKELHVRVPVYLMVTKCDLVAGFTEYFDDLSYEDRTQVWGVTFPYEQTLAGRASRGFPEEFDALIERLNARMFERLEEIRDPRRRTKTFAFPQQMAALRDALSEFVSEVFASTRFDQQVLLRGVYFTSGTQEGSPVDRLLSSIGRRFGVAPEAIAPASGPGRAYFVERLLKEVIIGESGLAGVNRRLEARKAAVQLGAYVALGLLVVGGLSGLSAGYRRNRAYLTQAEADVAALQRLPPMPATASSLEPLLQRLNALYAVVESADRYRADTSWTMRWGLYQGRSVGNAARDAYLRELERLLLPWLAARFRARVVENAREPQKLVEALKSYVMLGEPAHLDKEYLQQRAEAEWMSNATDRAIGAALSTHFKRLLESVDTLPAMPIDRTLVAQARSSIRQVSMPRILYDQVKASYEGDRERVVRLDTLGIGTEQVFRRRSGESLTIPLSSLYGRAVFQEVTREVRAALRKRLEDDSWIWGAEVVSSADPASTSAAVVNLYELDYIDAWDKMLNDLEFVPFSDVTQMSAALRTLASPTSPLKNLLDLVIVNTALDEAPKPADSGVFSKIRQQAEELRRAGAKTATTSPPLPAGRIVTAHFQPIHRLMAGDAGKAPIDEILVTIAGIQKYMESLGSDPAGVDPATILSSPEMRTRQQLLQQQAAALPPGLRQLVAAVGDRVKHVVVSATTSEVEQKFRRDVVARCSSYIDNRYPFTTTGRMPEVTLADFGKVFGYEGVFDTFFNENLAKFVDASQHTWTFRPGSVTLPPAILEKFREAQMIRETFFAKGSQSPELAFVVTLRNLDPAATRFVLEIDEQKRELKKGSPPTQSDVKWPGGRTGHALASFESNFVPETAKAFSGPWAWFRMVDHFRKSSDAETPVVLDVASLHHKAQVLVDPSTALKNPFGTGDWNWRHFSCESTRD